MKFVMIICFLSVWYLLPSAVGIGSIGSNQEESEQGIDYEIIDESIIKLNRNNSRSPIILVPGLVSSRLQAQLDSTFKWPLWYCEPAPYYGAWFTVFVSVHRMLQAECWLSLIVMRLNEARNESIDARGVRIRPYRFGATEGVEYNDPFHISFTAYMSDLVDKLTRSLGYRKGVDLFAAPYDFRHSPYELKESLFEPMRRLIEQTSRNNNNRTVILMAHSMGCPVTLLFLNQQTEEWRSRYIRRFVSVSGPFLGSMVPVTGILFGDTPNANSFLPVTSMSRTLRSFSSLAFLYPNWQDQSPQDLVLTADGSYGTQNFTTMLSRTNLTDFKRLYELTRPDAQLARDFAPQVDTWCLYSHGVPTYEQVQALNTTTAQLSHYEQDQFDYEIIDGDGDGLVNSVSLQWCRQWKDRQSAPVQYQTFSDIEHAAMLTNSTVLDFIVTQILT